MIRVVSSGNFIIPIFLFRQKQAKKLDIFQVFPSIYLVKVIFKLVHIYEAIFFKIYYIAVHFKTFCALYNTNMYSNITLYDSKDTKHCLLLAYYNKQRSYYYKLRSVLSEMLCQ